MFFRGEIREKVVQIQISYQKQDKDVGRMIGNVPRIYNHSKPRFRESGKLDHLRSLCGR